MSRRGWTRACCMWRYFMYGSSPDVMKCNLSIRCRWVGSKGDGMTLTLSNRNVLCLIVALACALIVFILFAGICYVIILLYTLLGCLIFFPYAYVIKTGLIVANSADDSNTNANSPKLSHLQFDNISMGIFPVSLKWRFPLFREIKGV